MPTPPLPPEPASPEPASPGHTKGPWTERNALIYDANSRAVAAAYPRGKASAPNDPEQKANARLIAASPALFDALKRMLRLHYDTAKASLEGLDASNEAEAALAAAKCPPPTL